MYREIWTFDKSLALFTYHHLCLTSPSLLFLQSRSRVKVADDAFLSIRVNHGGHTDLHPTVADVDRPHKFWAT